MGKRVLTIGKIRGLQSTTSSEGVFNVLAFDHRQSFIKTLNPDDPAAVSYSDVAEAKRQVIESLAPYSSAVLLDPLYGAAQGIASGALPGTVGLLVSVEKTGYSGAPSARLTEMIPNWNIEKIKRMGADGVKLLIYYHPDAGELTRRQEELTKQMIVECKRVDIAFFLEPVCYSIDPAIDKNSPQFAQERPGLILEIVRRLGDLNPDVLKLEFPIDVNHNQDEKQWFEACRNVSKVSPCPWAVLSAGVNFDVFTRQVEVACKSGASGYIAGRAVWKEGIPLSDKERIKWLDSVAMKRLNTLNEIAVQHAVPWMDYYHFENIAAYKDWYKSYAED